LPGYYSLYDSLDFAEGVSIVEGPVVSYIGGDGLSGTIQIDFDGLNNLLVVERDTLIPGMEDTFYIAITLEMDYNVLTPETANCTSADSSGSTGLTNVGTLVSPANMIRDTVCTPIPIPGVVLIKSIVSDPAPTGNVNEFVMTYVITVEDTTGVAAYYDLSDTLKYGAGATFVSGTVRYGGTDGLQTSVLDMMLMDTAFQIVDDERVDSLQVDS